VVHICLVTFLIQMDCFRGRPPDMKTMSFVLTFTMLAILFGALPAMSPQIVFARHHDSGGSSGSYDNYNQGFYDGGLQVQADWDSHQFTVSSGGNSVRPDGHSHAYCQGFNSGYANEWNRAIAVNYPSMSKDQSQGSNINIKGNDNRVQVNQGQNSGDSGSSGGSSDGSGANPQCRILCASIR
ncbi:MAG TPA: hypothetical protein VE843_02470, partial [Ktedonobacteraceae bacterium]|nr:hypothetical protein [Ktedonobacteraceae bacterium]